MANELLVKTGTPIVWADTTDYSSSGSGYTRTHQIDLTALDDGGDARQGDKADLGATWARCYACYLCVEFDVAPTAAGAVELWWASSASATAGTGNAGGASGSDSVYKFGEEAEWKKQLTRIGALIATNDGNTSPQRQFVGFLFPSQRYGMPIVLNQASQDLNTTDAVEMYVALVPLINEIQ